MDISSPHEIAELRQGILRVEFAEMVGVTPRTLSAWEFRGYGPKPNRDRGRCVYNPAEVAAFLRANAGVSS